MSKDTLTAIAAGCISAFASMAFLSGIPGALLIVYVAPLPLLLAGLAMGQQAAALASISGIVITGLVGGATAGMLFAVFHGLPMWMIARLALLRRSQADGTPGDWYPSGSILAMMSVYAAGGLIVALVSASPEDGGLRNMIATYLDQVFAVMMPDIDAAILNELIEAMVPMFPGYVGISWMVMVSINVAGATAVLKRAGRAQRPPLKMSELVLPDWLSWLLIGAAVVALIGADGLQFAGRNLALILAVPFFFLGLSVVHTVANRTTFPGMFLVGFYVFLLLTGWIAFVVIAAGLAEQWTGLRGRLDQDNNVK
ncbi:MAG: DUF2232 domain-containing protein [Alphaproteobacteria bacterium]